MPLAAVPDRALVRVRYWRDIDVALLDRSSGDRLGRERKGGDGEDEGLREREHGGERRGVVKGEKVKAKTKSKLLVVKPAWLKEEGYMDELIWECSSARICVRAEPWGASGGGRGAIWPRTNGGERRAS